MANVLIVAYLLIVLALIAVILLQRSEGGALGIGGGGGGGGFMTARGSANLLTRTTAILATLFFATAIGLTILSELDRTTSGILERATTTEGGAAPTSVLDALNSLQGGAPSDLPVPASDPVAPAGTDPVTEGAAPAPAAPTPEATSDLPVPEAPAAAPTEDPVAPATN